MEDHTKHPAGHANVAENDVVGSKRVGCRDVGEDLGETVAMREKVEERE